MDRKLLIDALSNVDPARSVMNSNEVMKTFWFTGKRVMAFDGGMALGVAFESEWQGAVQATLLPLLKSSSSADVTFEEHEKGIRVKAGSSKFRLLTMSNNDFNFKFPKAPENWMPIVDVPKFCMALKACKRSLGSETSESAFKGVTIIAKKGGIEMYSYDRMTLTQCKVKLKGEVNFERVVIPTKVVDQLIRITEGATELDLHINKDIILARCGNVTLWSELEEQDRVNRDFPVQVQEIAEKAKSTIDMGDKDFMRKFPAMLERSVIISSDAVESTMLRISVAENKIKFYSKSTRGVVEDSIMPPKGQKHHDVELRLPPSRLLAALELGTLAFTEGAAILSNLDKSINYFVSGE